jgi:hypothetical protein
LCPCDTKISAAYGTYGREDNFVHGFGVETSREHLKDLGVDGRIILK